MAKTRLIWDDCTPTRDRRPTTAEDVKADIHLAEFDTEDELLDKVIDLVGWDEDDLQDYLMDNEMESASVKEKIETLLRIFDDPGDGSPNILYCSIDGQELEGTFPYDNLEGLKLETCSEEDIKRALLSGDIEDESLNEDSHTMQSYKDWINEPTFEEEREEVLNDIKNNPCLNDGEKLELFTMINNKKDECLNEEKEEDDFFYKWRRNLQDKYHISPLGDIGGKYYIHVAQGIDPSGHVCAGYRDPTQEELDLCVKEAEALGQKAEIVDKDHIRIIEGLNEADESSKGNPYDPEDLPDEGMSQEELKEYIETPFVLQQGEDGELEYLGFFKNRDDALASYDPSFVYETTYINELDKDTYLAMRDEGVFDDAEEKELNAFFGINESVDIHVEGNDITIKDNEGEDVAVIAIDPEGEEAPQEEPVEEDHVCEKCGHSPCTCEEEPHFDNDEPIREEVTEGDKEFNYKGIHIVYSDGEEQDIKDLVDEMLEFYYEYLKDAKEINFAFSDEDGNFIIDGQLYQYAGGRLYGPYGKVRLVDGKWYKEIED